MRNAGEAYGGDVCNKCGDQGFLATLLKCIMCKLVREHRYCTVTFPTVAEPWICETCVEKKETMQMPYKRSPFNRIKENAKVKFISAGEVASLALESQTPVSSTRRRLCTSVTGTNSIHKKPSFMSQSMSTGTTARAEVHGYSEEKTSCISTPPSFQPLTVDNETFDKSFSAMNSADVLASPLHGNGENLLTRSNSRCDLRLSSLHMNNEHLPPPDKALGTQRDKSDFQGSSLLSTFPNGDEIQWRGRLMIKDVGGIHIYDDIQAHFPYTISSKAYDASKTLAEVLQFRFSNRQDNWPKIFQQDPPSSDDVAMYFLPSEICRRKEKYIRLLERMNNHDLAMCCLLDGFELLIYTSKLLSLDLQILNTKVYLWGIFRHRRTKKPNQETGFSGEGKHTNGKMQIGMIGGNDVGKADKAAVKRPGMQKDQSDNHKSALVKLQKSHKDQDFPSVPPGFSNQETEFSGEGKYTNAKMQIGMIGGNDVGKADKAAGKHPGMQKDQSDNHISALVKLQNSHKDQNFPSLPPGFSKLRNVDWNSNKKPLVKPITNKPDSHTISNVPPSFFEQINMKPERESSGSTGKSIIPPVYKKENAASCGPRGKHIISCSNAKMVNSLCHQAPLISDKSKFRKVTVWGEAPPAESNSLFSPGYDSPESPSRTNSMLSLIPESKASKGNAAEHRR